MTSHELFIKATYLDISISHENIPIIQKKSLISIARRKSLSEDICKKKTLEKVMCMGNLKVKLFIPFLTYDFNKVEKGQRL